MQQQLNIQDESNDRRYFTIIPNFILNHSTIYDREVFVQMKRIAGEDGTCWTSQKTLSKQCGISINRLKKSIQYLVDHKWIKFVGTKKVGTKGGNQEVNEYRIADLWKMNVDFYQSKGVSPNNTPCQKETERGITPEAKGVSPGDDKEEPCINKNPIIFVAQGATGNETNDLIDLFKTVNPTWERLFGNKSQRAAIERLVKKIGRDKVEGGIKILAQTNAMEFSPKIFTPYELEKKLGALIAFVKKEGNKINKNKIAIL